MDLGRFEHGKHLPLLHMVANVDRNGPDEAGDLRHDVDILVRKELGRQGEIVCQGGVANDGHGHDGNLRGLPALWSCIHRALPRARPIPTRSGRQP